MRLRLDHLIVPSRDRKSAAALLASILDVPWSEDTAAGPFSPVYVSHDLTLDLGQVMGEFSPQHYCFHVSEEQFDTILGRLVQKASLTAARQWARSTCRAGSRAAAVTSTGASRTGTPGRSSPPAG